MADRFSVERAAEEMVAQAVRTSHARRDSGVCMDWKYQVSAPEAIPEHAISAKPGLPRNENARIVLGYVDQGWFSVFRQSRSRRWFRGFDSGPAVKRFSYLRDPLFVGGCLAYALNRFVLKPHFTAALLHNWFNDALLIPCALPPLLLAHRWLGLRKHDAPPTALEVAAHVIGWSALFEWAGPHIMRGTTGDPWDVVAYCAGGVAAFVFWA